MKRPKINAKEAEDGNFLKNGGRCSFTRDVRMKDKLNIQAMQHT